MSTPARFLVAGAIAAVAAGLLWSRHDGAKMTQPVPIQGNRPSVVIPVPVTPTAATERNVAEIPPSARVAPVHSRPRSWRPGSFQRIDDQFHGFVRINHRLEAVLRIEAVRVFRRQPEQANILQIRVSENRLEQ